MEGIIRSKTENEQNITRFVFVGSPLLDISAKCDRNLLKCYDLKSDDCIRATDKHDTLFQTLFSNPTSHLSAGGSAQNSALIAKWVLGDRGKVAFVGCVGRDDFGKWMADQLLSAEVEPLYVWMDEDKTGVCACLLASEEERSMCTRTGAAALFGTHHLATDEISSHLKTADCIFVVGYFLAHSPEVVLSLAKLCSPTQVFSLSLSATYICRDHADILLQALPRIDVLFGNEDEVKAFAYVASGGETYTVERAAQFISESQRPPNATPRIVVVSSGSNPVIVAKGSNNLSFYNVPQDIVAVDSVGCGDALAGAFLADYTIKRNIDSAAQTGIWAASHIAQMHGCAPFSRKKSASRELAFTTQETS